jgi:hypothetical protein
VDQIVAQEPLISSSRKPQLARLLAKLVEKQVEARDATGRDFFLFKGACAGPAGREAWTGEGRARGEARRRQSEDVTLACSEDSSWLQQPRRLWPPPQPSPSSSRLTWRTSSPRAHPSSHHTLPHPLSCTPPRARARLAVLRAHILPLTNCAFNKSGDKFITGSYDRTCKVWNTMTGEELLTLEGHKNVVYAIAFNNPFGCVCVWVARAVCVCVARRVGLISLWVCGPTGHECPSWLCHQVRVRRCPLAAG